jgi:pimeloyl-ACP methyl ester carboxylesterase
MKSNQKLHVIYIPGLGDHMPDSQRRVVAFWRHWGVEAELFQMDWADDVAWEVKFARLIARIDELTAAGKPVALVGASAGASAVINAYAARKDKIVGVVSICGKINHPEGIGERYRRQNPSFIPSAYQAPQSVEQLDARHRARILCRYAIFDGVVPKHDSQIPGARNRTSPTFLHSITIALQITLGAPSFLRFLKKQQNTL